MKMWPWSRFRREHEEFVAIIRVKDDVIAQQTREILDKSAAWATAAESRDRWKKRYLGVNDLYSAQQAPFTQVKIDLATKTERLTHVERENERLSFEYNTLRDNYTKLAESNVMLQQTRPRADLGSDDIFGEVKSQPDRFVDEPGATPAELGDRIASALAHGSDMNVVQRP